MHKAQFSDIVCCHPTREWNERVHLRKFCLLAFQISVLVVATKQQRQLLESLTLGDQ